MESFPNIRFLLDENVSFNLKRLIKSKGFEVKTLQDINKRGTKNSELLKESRKTESVLITCDKDFLNIKKNPEDLVIIIDIHPLIDENTIPVFENFLKNLKISDLKNNIIVLTKTNYILKPK